MLCKCSWKAHLYLGKHKGEKQSVSSFREAGVATGRTGLSASSHMAEDKIYEQTSESLGVIRAAEV